MSNVVANDISILYTVLYVLPFYLHPTTRPSPFLSRDDPHVIRTRIRLVTLSVTLCTTLTYLILTHYLLLPPTIALHTLGLYPVTIGSTLRPVCLTALLFAGPLFEYVVVDAGWREWDGGRPLIATLMDWIGIRTYIAGPITEELLFRSLVLALHLQVQQPSQAPGALYPPSSFPSSPASPPSPAILVLVTPLYFGIAHVHHYYEFGLTHPSVPVLPAVIRSLVQLGYTTVFGWYAAFLYLRTGNVYGVVLVHSFCNWMGLPRVWGRVGEFSRKIPGNGIDVGRAGGEHEWTENLGVGWTWTYYAILFGGVTVWWWCLWPLTKGDPLFIGIEE